MHLAIFAHRITEKYILTKSGLHIEILVGTDMLMRGGAMTITGAGFISSSMQSFYIQLISCFSFFLSFLNEHFLIACFLPTPKHNVF